MIISLAPSVGQPAASASTATTYTVRWTSVPSGTGQGGTVALTAPCPYGSVTDFTAPGAVGCGAGVLESTCVRADTGTDSGLATVTGSTLAPREPGLKASFTLDCGTGNLLQAVYVEGSFSPNADGGQQFWGKGWPDSANDFLEAGNAHLALTHLTWHAGEYSVEVHGLNTSSDYAPCALGGCQWVLQGGRVETAGADPTVSIALANGYQNAGTPSFAVTAAGPIPVAVGGPLTHVRAILTGAGATVQSAWIKLGDFIDGYDLNDIATAYLAELWPAPSGRPS